MPKPIFGINGSGMHTHQSLFRDGKNAFHDPKGKWELSQTALQYIAGLLRHARGFCAVTNPLVNSYKRLVPGYEAPTNVAWSMRNRSPLIRIPDRRGMRTRCELRMPDPSANPYLALAVQLGAGLSGIESKLLPPDPVNKNIFEMSFRERRKYRIDELPRDLHEALEMRSEEHTSELQSPCNLVCRLLLEKKKTQSKARCSSTTSSCGDPVHAPHQPSPTPSATPFSACRTRSAPAAVARPHPAPRPAASLP